MASPNRQGPHGLKRALAGCGCLVCDSHKQTALQMYAEWSDGVPVHVIGDTHGVSYERVRQIVTLLGDDTTVDPATLPPAHTSPGQRLGGVCMMCCNPLSGMTRKVCAGQCRDDYNNIRFHTSYEYRKVRVGEERAVTSLPFVGTEASRVLVQSVRRRAPVVTLLSAKLLRKLCKMLSEDEATVVSEVLANMEAIRRRQVAA